MSFLGLLRSAAGLLILTHQDVAAQREIGSPSCLSRPAGRKQTIAQFICRPTDDLHKRIERLQDVADAAHSCLVRSRLSVEQAHTFRASHEHRTGGREGEVRRDERPEPAAALAREEGQFGHALAAHEASRHGPDDDLERERRARQRLLEWEAADLTQVVPGEMETQRRQFAVFLYQTVAKAQTLGMSDERFLYHVRYALEHYRSQE